MPKKVNWENLENVLVSYWIKEKKGLGLKKHQFEATSGSRRYLNIVLMRMRKEKKVYHKRKRWCLSPKVYEAAKQNI